MKKKLTFFVLLALLGAFVFSLEGCGDDPKPDPCAKEKPVTADFFIYETFGNPILEGWKNVDADTVAAYGVTFLAAEKNAVYEWTLGAETITTRSFYREKFPRGQNLDLSLKVTKTPNKNCFPNDDGVDFKRRSFYTTIDFGCSSRINGTFRGTDEDAPNDVRDVTFEICAPNVVRPDLGKDLRINNLTGGCDIFDFLEQPGYTQLGFSFPGGGTPCLAPVGVARLDSLDRNSIIIIYTRIESSVSEKRIKKKFIGKRIK
jgi:hypothetical protein